MRTLLILLLTSIVGNIKAQQALNYSTNALRPDSIIKIIIPQFDHGIYGEGIVWDFSKHKNDKCEYRTSQIYSSLDGVNWDENGQMISYRQRNDTLYIKRIETPLYEMDYEKPIVIMTFPLFYGNRITNPFHGEGKYEHAILLEEEGISTTEADGTGSLILQENDTINNILRTHTSLNSDVKISTEYSDSVYIVHKRTDIYRWYAAGVRYPLLEKQTVYLFTNDKMISQKNDAYFLPHGMQYKDEDETYKNIKDMQLACRDSLPDIEDILLNQAGNETSVSYRLNNEARIIITLADAKGILYWHTEYHEKAGEGYSHTVPLNGLRKGQYVLYLNVNGSNRNYVINID